MNFDEWLRFGYENGWCGPDVCETHDGVPMSNSEMEDFETSDPCIHIVRLYESVEHKKDVEESHGPSVWRASNRGW
jgi:hypothetical protein